MNSRSRLGKHDSGRGTSLDCDFCMIDCDLDFAQNLVGMDASKIRQGSIWIDIETARVPGQSLAFDEGSEGVGLQTSDTRDWGCIGSPERQETRRSGNIDRRRCVERRGGHS